MRARASAMSKDVEEIFVQTLSALRTPEGQRRGIAYGFTALIHISAAILLFMAPPIVPARSGGGGGGAIDVRLFTIAGGQNAQSDAPLYEPTLADRGLDSVPANPEASNTLDDAPQADAPFGPVRAQNATGGSEFDPHCGEVPTISSARPVRLC